jgi:hypothetical protein
MTDDHPFLPTCGRRREKREIRRRRQSAVDFVAASVNVIDYKARCEAG